MKVGKGVVKKYSREYNRTLKNGQRKKYTTEQIQITVPKNEDIYENKEDVLIIPQSEIETFINLEKELEDVKIANYLHVEEVKKLEQIKGNNDRSQYHEKIEELGRELHDKQTQIQSLKENNKEDKIAILEKENYSIKDKYSKLIEENENLKTKYVNMKVENENLKTKYSNIKEENKNLKTKCSNLKEEHESIKEECSTLKEQHNSIKHSYSQVSNKYDLLKQENLNTKTSYAEIFEMNENLEKDYDDLLNEYNKLVDQYNSLEGRLFELRTSKNHDEYIANKVKEFILKNEN